MDASDHRRKRLVEMVGREIARTTGRRYQIDLAALDEQSLRELQRLFRDLEAEKQAEVRRAKRFPWGS